MNWMAPVLLTPANTEKQKTPTFRQGPRLPLA
jgi:hypothetical protein